MNKHIGDSDLHHMLAGTVLLSAPVTAEELKEAFREEKISAEEASASTDGDPILQYRDGHVDIFLTAIPSSHPDPEVVELIHPFFTTDEEIPHLINHQAQVMVMAASFNEAPVADVHQEKLAVHHAHTRALQRLLALPTAVGYHRPGTTTGIEIVKGQLDSGIDVPTFTWAPIWLWESDNGVTGYTYGLANFGQPELQVVDSRRDAREVFGLLNDMVAGIASGTLVLDDARPLIRDNTPIAVSSTGWLVDTERPARQLDF